MTSIRRELTVRLLTVTLCVALVSGAGLFAFVRARLLGEFDDALLAEARSISAGVVITTDGRLELDYVTGGGPDLGRAAYFEILWPDGSVFRRSASLSDRDLPSLHVGSSGPQFVAMRLPRGQVGRGVAFRFRAQPDPDEEPAPAAAKNPPTAAPPPPEMTIILAADRAGLDSTLNVLGSSMLLSAIALCLGAALAVVWAIRRGLRPLVRLADEADAIRGPSLHRRFTTEGLPAELRPIAGRLNELLGRLQEAFERERRFTSDAAHELRTPVAELRALAEVALRWPADAQHGSNYRETLDIANQMEAMIAALLSIARCEAGLVRARMAPVDFASVVRDAWASNEIGGAERDLRTMIEVPSSVSVNSDRSLLLPLIGNLIGNAFAHTPDGGRIDCRVTIDAGQAEFEISNTCDSLTEADLPHLFEPFWRKDASRTGSTHCGLGLSLVGAYAKSLGIDARVRLMPDRVFRASVEIPRCQNGFPDDPTSVPLLSDAVSGR